MTDETPPTEPRSIQDIIDDLVGLGVMEKAPSFDDLPLITEIAIEPIVLKGDDE